MEQIKIYDLKACGKQKPKPKPEPKPSPNLPGEELQWTIVAQTFDFARLQLRGVCKRNWECL